MQCDDQHVYEQSYAHRTDTSACEYRSMANLKWKRESGFAPYAIDGEVFVSTKLNMYDWRISIVWYGRKVLSRVWTLSRQPVWGIGFELPLFRFTDETEQGYLERVYGIVDALYETAKQMKTLTHFEDRTIWTPDHLWGKVDRSPFEKGEGDAQ